MTGLLNEGNVSRRLLKVMGDFTYQNQIVEYALSPQYAYGFQNNQLQENDFLNNFTFSLFHPKTLYFFAFGSTQTSHLRKIDFRWVSGGGIGLHLIRTPKVYFSITNAVIFEETNFTNPEQADINTLRLSTRLKGKYSLFRNRLKIAHLFFLQPSLRDTKNYRYNGNVSLQIPLNKYFNFMILADDSYESIVSEGSKNNDFSLQIGFSLQNF
jgi:hypothetical protein